MLVQCWSTVYDAGPTLNQHWDNVSYLLGLIPANTRRSHNAGLMLAQRRRHFPALCGRLVFAGLSLSRLFVSLLEEAISASRQTRHIEAMLGQLSRRWPSIEPALVQCALFAGTLSGDIDRDSVCPSVVITALSEF